MTHDWAGSGRGVTCDRCGQREATVHYTRIVGSAVKQEHLCPVCAAPDDAQFRAQQAALLERAVQMPPIEFTPSMVEELLASERRGGPQAMSALAELLDRHAAAHGRALPPEVRVFVERHRRPPA